MRLVYTLGLILIVLIVVLAIVIFLRGKKHIREGFLSNTASVTAPQGGDTSTLPKPEGTSTVPNTMPGSTTPNSTSSLATAKDLAAFIDILKTYNTFYENNLISVTKVPKYVALHTASKAFQLKIQEQTDTGTIVDNADFIKNERKKFETAIRDIRQNAQIYGKANTEAAIKTVDGLIPKVGGISIKDLQETIDRAKKEQKRLDDLRSEAPDIKKRSLTLEKVRLDLEQMVTKITKGDMTIAQVPIAKKELVTFLTSVVNPTGNIKPIPGMTGAGGKKRPGSAGARGSRASRGSRGRGAYMKEEKKEKDEHGILAHVDYNEAVKQLKTATKDLIWDVRVGYDPRTTLQRRANERVVEISKHIENGNLKKGELKAKMLELDILKQQIMTYNRRSFTESTESDIDAYESFNTSTPASITTEGYQPGPIQVATSQPMPKKDDPKVFKTLESPISSNDWRIRPGFEPTQDYIEKRASAASFDDSLAVPDYKKRVKFLCQQIRDAELGDPREFGCIEKQDEDVNPDYSWRGNYKMVCSRLGTTWGDWYPEMFGCPKVDAATHQQPSIKLND